MENPLSKVFTSAPPPPPPAAEVKIRTMRSDIASMMQSGGGAPTFQEVAVSGLSMEKEGHEAPVAARSPMPAPASFSIPVAPVAEEVPTPTPAPAPAAVDEESSNADIAATPAQQEPISETPPKNHFVPILIVTLIALLAIGVVGYFAYVLFK